jgi:hypothetical protein
VQFTASGGTGPYTYSLLTGSLPPGLTLDSSSGLLSGYPTTQGTYAFIVHAVDSLSVGGNSAGQTIQVQGYATYPAKLVSNSNIGPYNVHLRTPYGLGVPPGSGPVRTSWIGNEVLHAGASLGRLTWIGAEVLHVGNSLARVSWFGVEVLRPVDRVPGPIDQIQPVILAALREDYDAFWRPPARPVYEPGPQIAPLGAPPRSDVILRMLREDAETDFRQPRKAAFAPPPRRRPWLFTVA